MAGGTCPAGTFAFHGGSHCCRTAFDGTGNPIAYDSTTCFNSDRIDCPVAAVDGSCAVVRDPICGNAPVVATMRTNAGALCVPNGGGRVKYCGQKCSVAGQADRVLWTSAMAVDRKASPVGPLLMPIETQAAASMIL